MKRLIKSLMPQIFFKWNKRLILEFLLKLFPKKFYCLLQKEIETEPLIAQYFSREHILTHYAYEPVRDTNEHPDLYITQIRFFRMFEYFRKNFPEVFDNNIKVLNVGDTSGILFKAMGRKGLSANINSECIDNIRSKGIEAKQADACNLQFPDKHFDYSFCFQMLEHLPNPIAALNGLGRITKNKVFISVPNTKRTKIYNRDYWINLKKESWKEKSVRDVDCHVFEFSENDFKNILSFTNLRFADSFPISYFSSLDRGGLLDRFIKRNLDSYFRFFVLEPV